jgi:hypothetical protein
MFDITQAKPGDIIRAHDSRAPNIERILEITGACKRNKSGEVTIIGRRFGDYPWYREQPGRPMAFPAAYVFSLVDA